MKGLLSRSIVLCWLAFAIVACDEQPEAETATPERADPGRADPGRVSTVIAAKSWLDLKDRTPPEQWLASREAGEDVPSSSSGVAELRALLAQADRRYGETPRMIANRVVQLEAMLAEREGIFCEPASAVCVAGMMRDLESGRLPEGSTIVCTLTGHGLKDPDIAVERASAPVVAVEPEPAAVKALLLEHLR